MTRCLIAFLALLLTTDVVGAASNHDLTKANAALSKIYGQVMAQQHDENDRKALRDLERSWIAFKEKQCAFETGGADGALQRPSDPGWPVWSDCELRVTEARIEELRGLVCVGVSVCNPH